MGANAAEVTVGLISHATVLQRQARGTATRKMMRQASAKSPGGPSAPSGAGGSPAGSVVGGSPQPGRSPQKPRAPQSAPLAAIGDTI